MGVKSSKSYANDKTLRDLLYKFDHHESCSDAFREELERYSATNTNRNLIYYEMLSKDQLLIEIRMLLDEKKSAKHINECLLDYLRTMSSLIRYVKDLNP